MRTSLVLCRYYCKQVTSVDDSTDSMNCDKFLKMLRDGHIIDRHLTPLVVKHVFALTQLVRGHTACRRCIRRWEHRLT